MFKSPETTELTYWTLLEPILLSFAFDPEDISDLVVHVMRWAPSVSQVFEQFEKLNAAALQWGHFIQIKAFELTIESIDFFDIFRLSFHDTLCVFQINQAVEKLNLFI
jgi:hypothetical protein